MNQGSRSRRTPGPERALSRSLLAGSFLALAVLLLSACGDRSADGRHSAPPGGPPGGAGPAGWADSGGEPALERFRGIVAMAPDQRVFIPCEGNAQWWVVQDGTDLLGEAYALLAGFPNDPVYAEVVGVLGDPPAGVGGRGADYGLEVWEVRRTTLALEAPECPEPPPGVEARGGDPAWTVLAMPSELEYADPGRIEVLRLPAVATIEGDLRRWEAVLPDGIPVALEIRPGPCSDPYRGEWFPLFARWTVGESSEEGCAWEG